MPHVPHRRLRSTLARLTSAAFVLAFLVGQVATYQHLAFVQHARCADHGELVDIHPGSSAAVAITPAQEGALVATSDAASDHRHEHCALAPQRRHQSGLTHIDRTPSRLPAVRAFERADGGRVLVVQQAVFRLAPKNSPPA